MAELLNEGPVAHVRVNGRSFDISLNGLDVGVRSPDVDIKRALTVRLELSAGSLRDYVVDRHETGNLTVRPEAVFG